MNNTVYTDGHGIKVTTTQFNTGKRSHLLEGVLNASMNAIKPKPGTPLLIMIFGIVCGAVHLLRDNAMISFSLFNILFTANLLAIMAVSLLFFAGLLIGLVARTRYAVLIVTAEGVKYPIVSEKKNYISQIVTALQYALSHKSDLLPL